MTVAAKQRHAELWAMTAVDRIAAKRGGLLTRSELFAWVARRPYECPTVDGEWEFIARLTPEVAEAKR